MWIDRDPHLSACTIVHQHHNLASFAEDSYENHFGLCGQVVDLSLDLNWMAGYRIINDSVEVEVQGNRDWKMNDISAVLESIHVERVGFEVP